MKERFVLALSIVMLTVGCSHSYHKKLTSIEPLLWIKPDSALVFLEQNRPENENAKLSERAYWALMYNIALTRSYYEVKSDSLILLSRDYYEGTNDDEKKMLSWYYYAVVCKNNSDYLNAVVAFEKAEYLANQIQNTHYLGMVYREKGEIYGATNNNVEFIACMQKAIDYFSQASDPIFSLYAKYSLASALINDRQYERADSLLDELVRYTERLPLSYESLLLRAQIRLEQSQDAPAALSIYRSVPTEYYTLLDYPCRAYAYDLEGRKEDADEWLNLGYAYSDNQADSATVESMHARIERRRGNHKRAFQLMEHAVDVQDSLVRVLLSQSVSNTQRDYFKQEMVNQHETVKHLRRETIFLVVLGLFVVIIILIHYYLYYQKQNQRLREQMARLSLSEQDRLFLKKENASLVGALFRDKFRHIRELSDEYYHTDASCHKEQVFLSLKEQLRGIKEDNELFNNLYDDLNRYCDDIIFKLQKQVPAIKGNHLKTIALFFVGVPYNIVQIVMNAPSIEALKQAKSRYRKIINESGAVDASLFLEMLETKKTAR